MRVLHVVTAFPRDEDDPITPWLVELLQGLRDHGVDAAVLAPSYRGLGDQVVDGIPVHRFRYAPRSMERLTHEETAPDRLRRKPHYAALLPLYLSAGLLAGAIEGRSGWDVVHVHWPMPHALFGAALRAASGGRTSLVCSFYSVGLTWVDRRMPWLRPLLRWSARTADQVTANSSSTAERVRRLTGREARVVPSPAPLHVPERVTEVRPPLGGPGPLEILFVGRLVERKGVEYLVRALGTIVQERDARLTVVGEGPWEPTIRRAAEEAGVEDRVRLTGFISRERLEELYASSDLFVLPAVVDRKGDTEGLGVVLLEALLFQRPVVASAVGGIVDIVKDGETGWLVPPGEPRALARAVLEAAASPQRARRLAARGREYVLEHFATDAIVDETLRTYRRAVDRRRGAVEPDGEPSGPARSTERDG